MDHRTRTLRWALALLTAAATALALAACGGSSSGEATTLLNQTFSRSHKLPTSGNLSFNLTVNPSGSKTLTGPISLGLNGPFQSLGPGKVPESAFNVAVTALGNSASVTITSTGGKGYVTFEGQSYELPRATYQRLESSLAQISSSLTGTGSGALGKLGIQPLHWLANPQVVGTETVGGVSTTHIHAAINVAAFLNDLNTYLTRAASLGIAGAASFPNGISAATRQKISSEVQNPSFDVWTGQADKTVRKLEIGLTLPVTGSASAALGGLRSAAIGLSEQYTGLNQPQSISAPTALRPYSEFQTKLKALIQQIQSGIGGTLGGGAASSLGSGASGSAGAASSTAKLQAYSTCIQTARGNIAKMQQCAPLLNGQ